MARLEDKPFDEYVTVKTPRGGRDNISSARQAAEWLLYKWPSEIDTAKARAARRACLAALEGQREAAAARKAFREAAEGAARANPEWHDESTHGGLVFAFSSRQLRLLWQRGQSAHISSPSFVELGLRLLSI